MREGTRKREAQDNQCHCDWDVTLIFLESLYMCSHASHNRARETDEMRKEYGERHKWKKQSI